MRCLPLLLLFLLIAIRHQAQKKASVVEMMEQAKKEISSNPDMSAADKAALLRMMNSAGVKRGLKTADDHPGQMENVMNLGEKLTALPRVDARRVAMLPEKPFIKEQCYSYLAKLTKKVEAQVSNEDKPLVRAILAKTSGQTRRGKKNSASLCAASPG